MRHYFDQLLADLEPTAQVVDAIRPADTQLNEPQRRDLLARFGLTGDTALQQVQSLSGGERNRAALARLAASASNLLVLDEPTNHLDLWARDALEQSLNCRPNQLRAKGAFHIAKSRTSRPRFSTAKPGWQS